MMYTNKLLIQIQENTRTLESLYNARSNRWRETPENLNFTHSSRTAWSLLCKLKTGKTRPSIQIDSPTPESISCRLKHLSKPIIKKEHRRQVRSKLRSFRFTLQQTLPIMKRIEEHELTEALNATKCRKAAGINDSYPELVKNLGPKTQKWLLNFYNIISKQILSIFLRKKDHRHI